MRTLLRSCGIAFSMYSRIPMSRVEWQEKDMKYAISFFPLVGVVIGGLLAVWMRLFFWLFSGRGNAPEVLYFVKILLACLLPLLLTGGIHLDGFLDTSDALHSWRDREEKLRILSDPHIGAFAVIRLLLYAGAYFAAVLLLGLHTRAVMVWCLTFPFSRVLSGLAVLHFPKAKGEGTLYTFSSAADTEQGKKRNTVALVIEGGAVAAAMLWIHFAAGAVALGISLLTFAGYQWRANRVFGGITGDVAGWFLCRCELFMALGLGVSSVLL